MKYNVVFTNVVFNVVFILTAISMFSCTRGSQKATSSESPITPFTKVTLSNGLEVKRGSFSANCCGIPLV